MSNVIEWKLELEIKGDESYEKLVTYLGKNQWEFYAEPHYMKESSTVHKITIPCSWTNNLKHISKWIDKNISDKINF